MISLTVTNLDSFRRYREHDEITLAQLLRDLRRDRPQTPAMRAGEVLHSILENPPAHPESEFTELTQDGHLFRFKADGVIGLKPFRELLGKKTYLIGGLQVELRGKADATDGQSVEDHKLTASFDAQRYHDSYQWRSYLSIFGANRFTYNVFVGREIDAGAEGNITWEIKEFHQLTLYRYPELEADIECELEQFAEFAQRHLTEEAA